MELLAEAFDVLLDFVLDSILLSLTPLILHLLVPVNVITDPLSVADSHVELGDLVGILAGGWHFDWSLPVEIAVAQRVGQLLNVNFPQL